MRNFLLIAMIALFSVSMSFGQGRVVTGTVTDEDAGDPIPGVNVVIKGTSNGTVTDFDGKYSLSISEESPVLVYSFVGYITQEIEARNQSIIDVILDSDVTALSEVVVIGYGTQEKKEITSAVASVKAEDFNVGNVQNPAQLIQGKVAGLTITRAGGNPNGGYDIRLRGLSTLGANTQPLIVIDGVIGGDLNNVDPNDIASMDVLKDGSAAAIYGTRGSSGVIIVTTKTGKEGKMNVDFNADIIAETPYRFQPVLDATQWRQLSSEIGLGQDYGANTDWFDEITRTAINQVYNLAVSGGSKSTTYRLSLNYRDLEGIANNTGSKTINTRMNLNHKALNDRLTLTANFGASFREADYGQDDAFKFATIYNPTSPVTADDNTRWPDGINFSDGYFDQYGGYFEVVQFDYKNPVAIQKQNINDGKDQLINIQAKAAYEIIDNLFIDASYSLQTQSYLRGTYNSKQSFWGGMDRNGNASRKIDDNINQLFEATMRWNADVQNRGFVEVVGGYSFQEFSFEGFEARGGNFITDQFTYNNLGAAQEFPAGLGTVSSYKNSNKIVAFFGRANFNWNGTYFLSASGRYEGSSRFGENNKWGFFPGISGGVELANYINSSTVTNLKLRVSYGVTGNNLPEDLLSIERYGPGSNFFYNGSYVPGYGPVSNSNPDLRWEKKAELNIGVDYSVLNDRIFGSIEYYSRETKDLLQQFTVPVPPNLFDKTWTNVGTLKNTGIELLVNWKAVNNTNFSYVTTVTFTDYLKNDIVSLSDSTNGFEYGIRDIANFGSPGQNNTPQIRVQEGWPIGQMWGLVYEGVSPTGDWVHQDLNDDGQIDNLDRTLIGNGLPKVELGWGNNLSYKRWDFNVFFRGIFGHDLINQMPGFYGIPNVIVTYNPNEAALDMKNENGTYLNTSDGKFSSLHVERASYFKLDNMSIGYNFAMANSNAFRKIRLYLTSNNLFVITNYTGSDPEVRYTDNAEDNAGLNNPLAPGIDRRNTWFMARSFSIGASFGF